MRKYILTHANLDNSVIVEYNEAGRLYRMTIGATLNDKQYAWLLSYIPVEFKDIQILKNKAAFNIVEQLFEPTFEDFYATFGNKVGKLRAEKVWNSLSKLDQGRAFGYISKYKTWLKINEGVPQLHPVTYLNQKRWLD
jgi:hypothetical protein